MTKLAKLFLGLGLVMATSLASAQERTAQPFPFMGLCGTPEAVLLLLQEEYGEIPFAQGPGAVSSLDGTPLPGNMVLYVNPETLTFTVTLMNPAGTAQCMIMNGEDFSPGGPTKSKIKT